MIQQICNPEGKGFIHPAIFSTLGLGGCLGSLLKSLYKSGSRHVPLPCSHNRCSSCQCAVFTPLAGLGVGAGELIMTPWSLCSGWSRWLVGPHSVSDSLVPSLVSAPARFRPGSLALPSPFLSLRICFSSLCAIFITLAIFSAFGFGECLGPLVAPRRFNWLVGLLTDPG